MLTNRARLVQVGNKKDLEHMRQVQITEAQDIAAKKMFCQYIETSAMVRVECA
jgi:hypothetical protein